MTGIVAGGVVMAGVFFGWPVVPVIVALLLVRVAIGDLSAASLVFLTLLCLLGAWRSVPNPAESLLQFPAIQSPIPVRVDSPPLQSGDRIRFDATYLGAVPGWPKVVCATAPGYSVPSIGDSLLLGGELVSLQEVPLNRAEAYAQRGCQGFVSADSLLVYAQGHGIRTWLDGWRRQLIESLQSGAPGDNGALMSGLVTGDDGALSYYTRTQFAITGTSHVTAVSGSNFAILIVVAAWIGSQIGLRRNWLFAIATILAVWIYAITVGLGAPPLRAALFATLALVGQQFGRKPDFVTIGLIAGALQLLVRPADAYQLGFQLSWVSTMALVLVLGGFRGSGNRAMLGRAALASMAAWLATLPIILATFGTISLATFPANLLISPLVAFAFPLSLIAGFVSIASPALGQPLIDLTAWFTSGMLTVVRWGAELPWAQVRVDSTEPVLIWAIGLVVLGLIAALSRAGRNWWADSTDQWSALNGANRQMAMAMIGCFLTVPVAASFF